MSKVDSKTRKAQEEITGFVLIVVIVAVIALILLSISIRKGSSAEKNSIDVEQFLESSMEYTTECGTYAPLSLSDLVKECYENPSNDCGNGNNVCDELNNTMKPMLTGSWDVGENKFYKAYVLSIAFESNSTKDNILVLNSGNCSGSYREAEYLSYYTNGNKRGSIVSRLRMCYS